MWCGFPRQSGTSLMLMFKSLTSNSSASNARYFIGMDSRLSTDNLFSRIPDADSSVVTNHFDQSIDHGLRCFG